MNNPKLITSTSPKNLLFWLASVGTITFIALVQWLVDWRSVFQAWQNVAWQALFIAATFVAASYAARVWRLMDFFPNTLSHHPKRATHLALLDHFFNQFGLPRQANNAFTAMMHRVSGIAYAESQSATLWFRLLDLHTLLCFLIYPLLVITPFRRLAVIVLALWLLIPLVIYATRHMLQRRFLGDDTNLGILAQQTLSGLPDNFIAFLKSWGITWLIWGTYLLGLAWFLRQLMPDHSFNVLILALVAGELALLIPLHSILKMPLYEVGVVFALFGFIGWQAALVHALNLHLFSLAVALIGGGIAWLFSDKTQQPSTMTKI